jgi:hypothetical protein
MPRGVERMFALTIKATETARILRGESGGLAQLCSSFATGAGQTRQRVCRGTNEASRPVFGAVWRGGYPGEPRLPGVIRSHRERVFSWHPDTR